MDRSSPAEQSRLVARYVAGNLSKSEIAEFEAWLLSSPELATEVENERRLRRGIDSARRKGWLVRTDRHRARRRGIAIASVSLVVGVAIYLWVFGD